MRDKAGRDARTKFTTKLVTPAHDEMHIEALVVVLAKITRDIFN